MRVRLIFAAMCAAILMNGCERWTGEGGATEDERCYQLGKALPTRSHVDTEQTQAEIQNIYAVFSLTCPRHAQLVPK